MDTVVLIDLLCSMKIVYIGFIICNLVGSNLTKIVFNE